MAQFGRSAGQTFSRSAQYLAMFSIGGSPLNIMAMVLAVLSYVTTGFPEVGVTPLIAHISLMPGPIIKPFDSMKVKTG